MDSNIPTNTSSAVDVPDRECVRLSVCLVFSRFPTGGHATKAGVRASLLHGHRAAHSPIFHRPHRSTPPADRHSRKHTSGSDPLAEQATIPPATSSSAPHTNTTTTPATAASDMTSMMYPVMFPTQQPQHFSSPHFYAPVTTAMASSMAFVPEELRCQYSSKRCENTRTNKKSGGLHKFCAVHREKANRNQMRLDHRRRVLKRMAQREQQRTGGSRSAPSSVSSSNSPYQKRIKDEDDHGDDHAYERKQHKQHSRLIKVEDDLDIDLMPLALHSENAASTSSALFDQQDLHILETLLFSDEDQADDKAEAQDSNMGDAASVCHGECCGHSSPSSSASTRKPTQHTRTTHKAKNSPVSSWSINL